MKRFAYSLVFVLFLVLVLAGCGGMPTTTTGTSTTVTTGPPTTTSPTTTASTPRTAGTTMVPTWILGSG
jgi:hypothetical protein